MSDPRGVRLRLPAWIVVAIIAAVGAAYRLAIWIALDPEIGSDGIGYAMLGQNLAEGRGFVDTLSYYGLFAFWRPPLYPAMISALYPVVGSAELAGRLISFACSVLLIPLVFVFVRDLWNENAGLWSAALTAGYVTLVLSASEVAVEPLFHCLLVWLAILLWREWRDPRARRLPLVFALTAVLYLTRFEAIFYIPVVIGVATSARVRTRAIATTGFAAGLAAGAVLFGLIAFPYVRFVHEKTGRWAPTAATAKNILYGWNDSGVRADEMRAFFRDADGAPLAESSVVDPRRESDVVAYVMRHPSLIAETYVGNVVRNGNRLLVWWPVAVLALGFCVGAGRKAMAPGIFLLLLLSVPLSVNPVLSFLERSMRHVLVLLICASGMGLDVFRSAIDDRLGKRFARLPLGAFGAAIFAGAVLLHSARWTAVAVRYADRPTSRYAMGAWMRANGLSGQLVMATKLYVPYYAGSRYLAAPPFPPDELAAYGCERNARYLVVDSRSLDASGEESASFAALDSRPSDFRLLHEEAESNGHRVRIFAISCAR